MFGRFVFVSVRMLRCSVYHFDQSVKDKPNSILIDFTQHQSYKKMKPAGFQERRKGNQKSFWSLSGYKTCAN